jgi:hypothetical protein
VKLGTIFKDLTVSKKAGAYEQQDRQSWSIFKKVR